MALRNRSHTSVELTKKCFERANKRKDLNAFISLEQDIALEQAEAADRRNKEIKHFLKVQMKVKEDLHKKQVIASAKEAERIREENLKHLRIEEEKKKKLRKRNLEFRKSLEEQIAEKVRMMLRLLLAY